MPDYLEDVRKYSPGADEAVVKRLVNYCGIALRNADSATVAATDPKELATVREGFAKKKLELETEAADAGIAQVCATMKGVNRKSRVTFYYLLAEFTDTLHKL